MRLERRSDRGSVGLSAHMALQDAERQRAGLGSDNDRPPLGDDSKRGDDRIRPAADRGDKPAIVCVRAESAEGAEEKVGGVASKHEL